jgi:hypothetical protein
MKIRTASTLLFDLFLLVTSSPQLPVLWMIPSLAKRDNSCGSHSNSPEQWRLLTAANVYCPDNTHCCGAYQTPLPHGGCCPNDLFCCSNGDGRYCCHQNEGCCPNGCCTEHALGCDGNGTCIEPRPGAPIPRPPPPPPAPPPPHPPPPPPPPPNPTACLRTGMTCSTNKAGYAEAFCCGNGFIICASGGTYEFTPCPKGTSCQFIPKLGLAFCG